MDISNKVYVQLQLVIINEMSLVGNKMLAFIDCKLCVIKKIHRKFMDGLDVIMTCVFYQTPLV
jgi:hypothetical protein